MTLYEYKVVDIGLEETTAAGDLAKFEEVAIRYAAVGWRVVGVIPAKHIQIVSDVKIHDGGLMLEREKRKNPYNKQTQFDEWYNWSMGEKP